MYLRIACLEEPDRSFNDVIHAAIISPYLGWSAGFFGAAFFAGTFFAFFSGDGNGELIIAVEIRVRSKISITEIRTVLTSNSDISALRPVVNLKP